ncbi:MAG TPA: integrase core domain-containing protein, partial [Planctomycetaceae bacterium]|nr:integrase core domain-containing protein [Planctomycetaceae bacterium]
MKLFHPLLALIASATESELARQVRYLKEENRILRDRIPGEIHTRKEERARLLKFGRKLGNSIYGLITIVTPVTFRRWMREEAKPKKAVGCPRTNEVLRELVHRIARETGFGYKKILGELRRLGINRICQQTVRSIVKEEGIGPSPKRSQRTWDEFLTSHAETLWACVFFRVKTITRKGFVDLYVLVFLHVDSRRLIVSPATQHPDSNWVTEQAKAFHAQLPNGEQQKFQLIHDRDAKFSAEFRQAMKERGVTLVKLPVRSPNLNSRCERVVQTIKYECLNHFIIFGQRHLDYLLSRFVEHYNERRAHSSLNFRPPACSDPPPENNNIDL